MQSTTGSFIHKKSSIKDFILWWGILFAACILVRLPNFLSDSFWFDGDEAMIGIMAQDLLAGKAFPIYFYGQNYGLSIFEVISTALFELFIGPSPWSLKLGGLLLFSLGITFIVRTIRQLPISSGLFYIIIVLLISYPTWYLWGTMVRGGYVTAFLFDCIIFYLVFRKESSYRQLVWLGISIGIAFESHIFILIGILPVLGMWFLKQDKKLQKILFITTAAVVIVVLLRLTGYYEETVWNRPRTELGMEYQKYNLDAHFKNLTYGFSNFFYYGMKLERPIWWGHLVRLFLVLSAGILLWDFLTSFRRKFYYYLFVGLSVTIYLFLISTLPVIAGRYWLGLFSGLLFWLMYVVITRYNSNITKYVFLCLAFISFTGIYNGPKFKRTWYEAEVNEVRAFEELYREVKKKNAKAVFITDFLIQWQWDYLYGREIPASVFTQQERTNTFLHKASKIYEESPDKMVIIGFDGMFLEMDYIPGFNDNRRAVNAKYFIHDNPKIEYINQGRKKHQE